MLTILGLIGHTTENFLGVWHVLHVSDFAGGQGLISWVLLETLHALEVNNKLDDMQALTHNISQFTTPFLIATYFLVLVGNTGGPVYKLCLETRQGNLSYDLSMHILIKVNSYNSALVVSMLTYRDILLIWRTGQVFVHLLLKGTLLVPPGPNCCIWGQV